MSMEGIFEVFITKAGSIPKVRIDREEFLRNSFKRKYRNSANLDRLIKLGPIKAKVPDKELNKIADQIIMNETTTVTMLSVVTGIPGGIAILGAVPADVVQFYAHVLRTVQKLMYLYGWEEDIFDPNGELDDETRNALILYVGAMFGVKTASTVITKVSAKYVSKGISKIVFKNAFKIITNKTMQKIVKLIGIKTSVKLAGKGISKGVPILGGVLSGLLTFSSFVPMTKKLKQYFASGNVAIFDCEEEEYEDQSY